jgi:DNA helicase-2/ATP-dependent DNA helicase PcrA
MHPIVRDEQDLLAKVSTLLAEHPYEAPPREDDLVAELVRLREEIPASKVEDQPALLDQYHQNVSTLEQLRASRDAPKVDPDSPYFAHLRLVENGKPRDICLGRATRIEAGVRIIDWRNAPISKLFYRYAQGDDYEEEFAGRMVRGEVVARRTVVIKNQELLRIEAPEGRYELRGGSAPTSKDRVVAPTSTSRTSPGSSIPSSSR